MLGVLTLEDGTRLPISDVDAVLEQMLFDIEQGAES